MEISISDILSIAGWLFGGGALGGILTWRYTRRTAAAQAEQAEADAAKEIQDVYQQLINDIKTDREEQKAYINELKEDRRHLREERDDLRKRQDELEETVRNLQKEVARNGRMVALMRPFVCGRRNCPDRIAADITEECEAPKRKKKTTDLTDSTNKS